MTSKQKDQFAADLLRAMRLSITSKFLREEGHLAIYQINLQRRKDGQRLTGSFQFEIPKALKSPSPSDVICLLALYIEIEPSMAEYTTNRGIVINDTTTFQSAQKRYCKARKLTLIVKKIFFDSIDQLEKFKS